MASVPLSGADVAGGGNAWSPWIDDATKGRPAVAGMTATLSGNLYTEAEVRGDAKTLVEKLQTFESAVEDRSALQLQNAALRAENAALMENLDSGDAADSAALQAEELLRSRLETVQRERGTFLGLLQLSEELGQEQGSDPVKLQSLQRRLQEALMGVLELSGELQELHGNRADLERECRQQQREADALRGDNEALRGEVVELRRGASPSSTEFARLREDSQLIRGENETLKTEMAELLLGMSQASQDQQALRGESAAMQRDNDALKEEMMDVCKSLNVAAHDQKRLHEETTAVRQENELLRSEMAEISKGVSQAQASLRQEAEALRGEKGSLKAEIEELRQGLSTAIQEKKRRQKEAATLTRESDALRSEVDELRDEARAAAQEQQALTREAEALRKENAAFSAEIDELRRAAAGEDKVAALAGENKRLKKDQQALRQEATALRSETEKLKSEVADLRKAPASREGRAEFTAIARDRSHATLLGNSADASRRQEWRQEEFMSGMLKSSSTPSLPQASLHHQPAAGPFETSSGARGALHQLPQLQQPFQLQQPQQRSSPLPARHTSLASAGNALAGGVGYAPIDQVSVGGMLSPHGRSGKVKAANDEHRRTLIAGMLTTLSQAAPGAPVRY